MENQITKKIRSHYRFSDDLILEIFHNLPPKSLCRFKCVSKSLRSSIEDPNFIQKTKPDILMEWDTIYHQKFKIFSINQLGIATYVQKFEIPAGIDPSRHCNGLMCYLHGNSDLGLFNPTTGKLIFLPFWSEDFEFGYDLKSEKYKVFGWMKGDDNGNNGCEFAILTVEKQSSWRIVSNTLGIMDLPDCATYANGSLFWIDVIEDRIISFDLGDEEFGIVELPVDKMDRVQFKYTLFEFDARLCLVERPNPKLMRCYLEIVNMWMLKDRSNGSSIWILLIKDVQLPWEGTGLNFQYTDNDWAYAPVFGRNGEIMILASCVEPHIFIFAFCFLSRQFRRIKVRGYKYLDMKLVRNHMENELDLEVFVQRREKEEHAVPYCAGYA